MFSEENSIPSLTRCDIERPSPGKEMDMALLKGNRLFAALLLWF